MDEPETVEDREVVGERRPVHAVLDLQTTPRASRNAVIYARPSLQDHDATTTTLAAECADCGGSWIGASAVLDLPLLGTEAADEEQYDADGQVGEDDAEPDVRVERVHEREDARLLLLRLLDHDVLLMTDHVVFLIMMLMPRFMNGLLKSMTRSRIEVIVIGAIAMSADFAPQTRAQQPLLQIRRD